MHPFMTPALTPNIVEIPPEARDKALQATANLLRQIDEVRRRLELPVEQLPTVIDIYSNVVLALINEERQREFQKQMTERTQRLPMTMCSDSKILPTQKRAAIIRPQTIYRPENLKIHGDPSRWMIHDLKIGNKSQFANKRGPALGSEFGSGGILENFKLETLQVSMDFIVEVEYVGPEEGGEVFEATIVGTSVA